jgi:chromobox protein 1
MGTGCEPVSHGLNSTYCDATDVLFSETAALKLKEYHESIGGPPDCAKGKKKGAQKRTASEALDSPVPSATKKRAGRKSQTNGNESPAENSPFVLPKGSWESEVSHVMSIVEEPEPDEVKPGKSNKILMGFLEWKDGRKSKHPMKTLRTKCPQALLTYYENHL